MSIDSDQETAQRDIRFLQSARDKLHESLVEGQAALEIIDAELEELEGLVREEAVSDRRHGEGLVTYGTLGIRR